MQGAGRPSNTRLFDRKRRRGYRSRASHGKERAGAGKLVTWGFRHGLKLFGSLLLLFIGFGFWLVQVMRKNFDCGVF